MNTELPLGISTEILVTASPVLSTDMTCASGKVFALCLEPSQIRNLCTPGPREEKCKVTHVRVRWCGGSAREVAAVVLQGLKVQHSWGSHSMGCIKVEAPNLTPSSEVTQITFRWALNKGINACGKCSALAGGSMNCLAQVWICLRLFRETILTEFAVTIPGKILDNLASILVLGSAYISV